MSRRNNIPDSYMYIYVCVWIPIQEHKIHPVGSETNGSPRRLNILFWGVTKWSNGLSQKRICKMFISSNKAICKKQYLWKKKGIPPCKVCIPTAIQPPSPGLHKLNGPGLLFTYVSHPTNAITEHRRGKAFNSGFCLVLRLNRQCGPECTWSWQ